MLPDYSHYADDLDDRLFSPDVREIHRLIRAHLTRRGSDALPGSLIVVTKDRVVHDLHPGIVDKMPFLQQIRDNDDFLFVDTVESSFRMMVIWVCTKLVFPIYDLDRAMFANLDWYKFIRFQCQLDEVIEKDDPTEGVTLIFEGFCSRKRIGFV